MKTHDPSLFLVDSLTATFGVTNRLSPLKDFLEARNFVRDGADRILADITLEGLSRTATAAARGILFEPATFELAGARERIFWEPASTKAAIVTCGGLAPGLNNVIQSIVSVLSDRYKVKNIYGVPYGYHGFAHDPESKRFRFGWRRLDSLAVQNLDTEAGSVLGSGRGNSNPQTIVDALALRDINILFTIGGDGTLAGAHAISEEVKARKLPLSIIGIPKTIDNDVMFVSKTFGFETAVQKASEAIRCAQTEARGAFNGIGLVKIMGRHSGALAATAAAATSDVDFVLIPEVDLVLEGQGGFFASLLRRVVDKGYATIVVAEGAGQNLVAAGKDEFDPSGNKKLADIGRFLKERIVEEFRKAGIETTLKYIDPSYMVRAMATTADDAVFCAHLGQSAVHAAMAGKTGMMVGYAHERFTHVPLKAVTVEKKRLDTSDSLWLSVLASTGQPARWV